MFENSSDHKKLAVKDKLQNIKMQKNDTIPHYLSRFTQVCDDLARVGVTVSNDGLVSLTFLGIPKI